MNRSSNVFNVAPLGSGGASGLVFISASQVCQAVCTASLRVGRMLRSTIEPTLQSTAVLRAGRKLKSVVQAQAVVTGRLAKFVAVAMSAALSATATTSATLTRLRPKALSSTQSAAAVVSGVLRHAKLLAGSTTATAVVTGKMYRGRHLHAAVTGFGQVSGVLNESSRSRASAERTVRLPPNDRTVIVPKG